MKIPDYESIMLPLLKLASDKQEHSVREAIDKISNIFKLSAQERAEMLPSATQRVIDNRVGWAKTFLKKAGLLETTKKAFFKITEAGLKVVKNNPERIDTEFLEQFPSFIEFKKTKRDKNTKLENEYEKKDSRTPQELIEYGFQKIKGELSNELLQNVKQSSPDLLEKLVVELLLSMGYGGSRKDAG